MDNEQQLIIKKLVHQTFQEQLEKLKKNKSDNSYLFLDSDIIQLIITIFLLKNENELVDNNHEDVKSDEINVIHNKLKKMIENQKKAFEELFDQLS
ncbi:hypothetical protein E3U55_12630 [Filobacillus milosensis]|uniref:Uncharacterized protein n=1 Tax=Filobacillus milosensis TaxID=94137 RepID=A0A4Y8ILT2_9BACI|nr:hypothetical protein [Filobacillus milosensis]TFB15091.1 hypothetical protein E3U55_12630 [Filobacillus milosensis]